MRKNCGLFKRIKLINLSIRAKLLLIYLLCVLIPTIVFSYAFYASTMRSTTNEKLILYQQSLDRISMSIATNAISAIELSNIIYPDEAMYEYINKQYTSRKNCLDDYNSYMSNAWDKILPYNTNIVLFTVYTNNDTLLNGKHLHRVDDMVTQYDWYQKYIPSGKRAAFISHTDELIGSSARMKMVSYFRKLNYLGGKYNHFMKITFQANMFDKIFRTESLPADLYVLDDEDLIIAQTNRSPGDYENTEFPPFDTVAVAPGQIVLHSKINAIEGWRVACVLKSDFMREALGINWTQMILLIASITVFASVVIYAISSSFYKRIALLVEHMGKVSKEEYNLIPEQEKGNDEVGLLITSMNSMITKIKSLIEDVYKAKIRETQLELLKKQSELNALQCQVNPHFMFNVLETIRIKSYLRNEFETARIVKYMSKIFRKLLLWNHDLIELNEEIGFIKEYLEIQQYRYEEELDFEITVDDSLLGIMIPKMTLQTFVDNACEHGFSESKGLKKVSVSVQSVGNGAVELEVFDNGKGMSPQQIRDAGNADSKGIGIKNVIGRLNLYYADNYDLKIDSKPGEYTLVSLTLHKVERKRSEHV